MDQDPGYAGIMVKLFGMDTLTADEPAKMAGLANYPIVSTFIHEDRPYHHVVEVLPPIKPYTVDQQALQGRESTASCMKRHRN